MEAIFTEDVTKGLAIGTPAVMVVAGAGQTALSTKSGQQLTGIFNKMKDALRNTISSSSISQAVSQASSKIAGTTTGKVVTSGVKTVKSAVPIVGDVGIDIGMGAYNIAQTAQSTSMSGSEKGYSITGDVLGIAANVGVNLAVSSALGGTAAGATAGAGAAAAGTSLAATGSTAGTTLAAGAATGPGIIIAIAVVLAQMLGAILDSFFNPFKNYFNRDLRDMRRAYDSELKRSFVNLGLNWPLEVKPDLIGTVFGNEETINEYRKYLQEYYYDKGLITEQQFLEDYQILLDLRKLKRFNKKFLTNEQGEIIGIKSPSRRSMDVLSDLETNLLEIEDDVNQNMLLMLALAAYIKRIKKLKKQAPSKIILYLQENYISVIISIITIIISIIISSILSVSS